MGVNGGMWTTYVCMHACILKYVVCALQSSDWLGRKYGKMGVWSRVPYNLSEHYEQFGVVLDDSGLETMLEKLMDETIYVPCLEVSYLYSIRLYAYKL
jgi:hypothetical protein